MMRVGFFLFSFFIFVSVLALGTPRIAFADAASDIQAQINSNNQQLEALKTEITAYQKQLDAIGSKKNTLQSAIDSLTLSQKQLATQIKATQNKIASANLQIRKLTLSIVDKEAVIAADQSAIAKALRSIAENEEVPLLASLISANSLGDAWRIADQTALFNRALSNDVIDVRAARTELATNRDKISAQKIQLVSLQNNLTFQKRSVDTNKTTQQKLLSDTKNQESNYQKLLAQKQAAEKAFEQELVNLQSQLNLIVHPNLLPKVGSGVLSWPFSNAFMLNCTQRKSVFGNLFCITQYFGNTPFATANPQIYNGGGHSAIDIGALDGTPVQAALSGIVLATGNTDLAHDSKGNQCLSFGKWVMIQHYNGLNTMYAHLSEIDVSKGKKVSTNQIIGLSGRTGYATGPHLHFGVYATEGTKIMTPGEFKGVSGTRCENATMPVASLDAYLNPLSYL